MTSFSRRRRFLAATRLCDTIIRIVSAFYGVPEDEIRGPRQDRAPSHARKVCMFILRGATGVSYAEIGRPFGNRDRGTVIHAVKDVEVWLVRDPELKLELIEIASAVAAKIRRAQLGAPSSQLQQMLLAREEEPAPTLADESVQPRAASA